MFYVSQQNMYNPDIHHHRSIRLKGYDYSQAGMYFVTICVQNRACFLGNILSAMNSHINALPITSRTIQ